MAKDDYHVIVYRILAYLYACLKSGEPVDMEYLTYGTKAFPVNESYWSYIITTLAESGYVRGVCFIPILGQGEKGIKRMDNIQITPAGIEYLRDNSAMKKAKEFLTGLKEIIPGL